MLYNEQFSKIYTFLKGYEEIANKEVLNYYPNNIHDYNSNWTTFLDKCDDTILWEIDSLKKIPSNAPESLIKFFLNISKISSIPFIQTAPLPTLPSWAWQKVSKKKQHEIEYILSYLNIRSQDDHKDDNHKDQLLIDICGGKGHLSRINSHYFNKRSIVIDYDSQLLKLGKKRCQKYPVSNEAKDVSFFQADLKNINEVEQILKLNINAPPIPNKKFLLGLHTCGSLALNFFKLASVQELPFLNFGCCYNKLHCETETSLSKKSSEFDFNFTKHALTLATRSNFKASYKNFLLTKKVKYYRYAIFLYLKNKKGISDFLALGSSPLHLYSQDFEQYALFNLKKLGIKTNKSENLNLYFNQKNIQQELKSMLSLTLIRWQLSRPLEIYLLLDRYFYLQEQGLQVDLFQYFDPTISPRNIGISCERS